MDFVYIGKIVSTHGIKGEIKIISNFNLKNIIFKPNKDIYFGNNKEKHTISSYRHHKNYDMITIDNLNDINLVLKYLKLNVYVKRDDLNLNKNEYILDDLIGMKIKCNDEYYGEIDNIYDNNGNILLQVDFQKKYYIPYKGNYIKKVNLAENYILTENIKDLII